MSSMFSISSVSPMSRSIARMIGVVGIAAAGWSALPANAQLTPSLIGLYVGASAGPTYADLDAKANNNSAFNWVDRGDVGGKLYAGFRFHRNFALEAGYGDFGRVTARTGDFTGFVEREWRTKGAFADLVGYVPIGSGRWSAFGKVGAAWTDMRVRTSTGGALTATPLDRDHIREVNFKFGFGGQFDITPRLVARAEVEVFTGVGDGSVGLGNGSIGLYSAGIQFRF